MTGWKFVVFVAIWAVALMYLYDYNPKYWAGTITIFVLVADRRLDQIGKRTGA